MRDNTAMKGQTVAIEGWREIMIASAFSRRHLSDHQLPYLSGPCRRLIDATSSDDCRTTQV
ncbi:MAG: hypothetical protein ACOCTL_01870 [Candidatus Hadarchaeota archaeon]